MKKGKLEYRKYSAFINRQVELRFLKNQIDEEPESILFIHGPKSSGKTTLLYRFFEQIQKEQKLDIRFLNLRKKLTGNYKDFIRFFFGIDYSRSKEDVKEKREYNLFKFFKLSVEVLKGLESGELDPFEIMEKEFLKQNQKGIKPVMIIDELNTIKHIYMENGKKKRLITELLNFFVTVTNRKHLAHVIISSSNPDFLNNSDIDSKLRESLLFYKVDFLPREDVMEWLLNLEKYSKIKDYTLTREDAGKIWDTVGGSMWEIQDILSDLLINILKKHAKKTSFGYDAPKEHHQADREWGGGATPLFEKPIDDVLTLYKKKIRGIIAYYIGANDKKEKALRLFLKKDQATLRDFVNEGIGKDEVDELLRDMVRNNILYFDPIEAIYYPQGKSYQWGINLYFESSNS